MLVVEGLQETDGFDEVCGSLKMFQMVRRRSEGTLGVSRFGEELFEATSYVFTGVLVI